jgi:transcription antitermination factor NusG
MPVLPAEPDMYPESLWEGSTPTASSGQRWWCLHARPRQEKAAARTFRARGLSYYLPQVARSYRTPGGRSLRSILPLFPGYLFLLGDDRERVEALKGGHLANVLDVPDQAALVSDLSQIHRMISSGLAIVPEPNYAVGSRVRMLSGPLKGLEGTVVRSGKRDRVVAMVRFLGGGATVDLDGWEIEMVEG